MQRLHTKTVRRVNTLLIRRPQYYPADAATKPVVHPMFGPLYRSKPPPQPPTKNTQNFSQSTTALVRTERALQPPSSPSMINKPLPSDFDPPTTPLGPRTTIGGQPMKIGPPKSTRPSLPAPATKQRSTVPLPSQQPLSVVPSKPRGEATRQSAPVSSQAGSSSRPSQLPLPPLPPTSHLRTTTAFKRNEAQQASQMVQSASSTSQMQRRRKCFIFCYQLRLILFKFQILEAAVLHQR